MIINLKVCTAALPEAKLINVLVLRYNIKKDLMGLDGKAFHIRGLVGLDGKAYNNINRLSWSGCEST